MEKVSKKGKTMAQNFWSNSILKQRLSIDILKYHRPDLGSSRTEGKSPSRSLSWARDGVPGRVVTRTSKGWKNHVTLYGQSFYKKCFVWYAVKGFE